MMLKIFKIALVAFIVFCGCGCQSRKPMVTEEVDKVVASVGTTLLHESEIKTIGVGLPQSDSLKLLQAHVNSWVRKQVKLQEAERVLKNRGVDVEALVRDYRNSLLVHRLDQYYVENKLDTVLTQEVVENYYKQHKSEFKLDRDIVKGRSVRVPNSYRQKNKLKELMDSPKADKQQDFIDLCTKNDFEIIEFDQWVDFKDFLTPLPTIRDKNYTYMFKTKQVQELSDAEYKYYVQITSVLRKGAQAPFERVDNIVRRIVYNKISTEFIKNYEDSLYNTALQNGTAVIDLQ